MMSYFHYNPCIINAIEVRFAETLEEEEQRSESGTVLKQEDDERIRLRLLWGINLSRNTSETFNMTSFNTRMFSLIDTIDRTENGVTNRVIKWLLQQRKFPECLI